MTPLQFAQSLAGQLAGVSPFSSPFTLPFGGTSHLLLPQGIHAQLGNVVIDCAGTWVTIINTNERDLSGCGTVEMADVNVVAALDCAFVAHEDGTTNWPAMDAVMGQLDVVTAELAEWARGLVEADRWAGAAFNGTAWTLEGGLAIVTIGMTLPVP